MVEFGQKLQQLSPAQTGKGWEMHWFFPKGKEMWSYKADSISR